jgi:hypothetical protein
MGSVILIPTCIAIIALGLIEIVMWLINNVDPLVWYAVGSLAYVAIGVLTIYLRYFIETHPANTHTLKTSYFMINLVFWFWWLVIWWYIPIVLYLKFSNETDGVNS